MDVLTDLVRWDVPFAEMRYPSVIALLTEKDGEVITFLVAQDLDSYPKYLVRFERVIALLYYEEAFAFDRGYRALTGIEASVCAYRWIDSPWIHAYRQGEDVFNWHGLQHYLIFGGDNIVEVVAVGEPTIERRDTKTFIEIKHEI